MAASTLTAARTALQGTFLIPRWGLLTRRRRSPGRLSASAIARFSCRLLQQLQDGATEERRGEQHLQAGRGSGGSRIHPQEKGEEPDDEDRLRVDDRPTHWYHRLPTGQEASGQKQTEAA
ncbi:hypothetical protein fugu_014292 [Takifugu bimaculatus]|uniref:Uncharacterized protein n=1 Tax=Takifugu bimaculatus TaxID=433685 RepID=A0A4Z2C2K6_9TELE|nr:hypothetical protein fugu_014292 [Takifugu bimaculatus]